MRHVITILFLFFTITSNGQVVARRVTGNVIQTGVTIPFTFTIIPFSSADLIAPFRGVERWNFIPWDNVQGVQVPAGNSVSVDEYLRQIWFNFELINNASPGVYSWTVFDNAINNAITAGRKFHFGVMPFYEGSGGTITVGGAQLGYPLYLHNQMQSDVANNRDWIYNGTWIPNWNSNFYLTAFENLLNAIANHIATTSFNGIPYSSVIGYVEIRGYGNFGEWHNYPWWQNIPAGRVTTVTALNRIINAHVTAFPNYPLIALSGGFDQGNATVIPPEIGYNLLTFSNTWGQFGWRRDNWGVPTNDIVLVDNPYSYNGNAYAPLIMNKWKFAPINGEPWIGNAGVSNNGAECPHFDLEREIRLYHASSFGNGNYENLSQQCMRDNVIAASKASGYRVVLEGGNMSASIVRGSPFSITLNWKNVGIAPVYENWNVRFELKNGSNVTVWSANSSHILKLWLPQGSATIVTDAPTVPTSVTPGTYRLILVIRDPNGYRVPFPLAITGRNADGSYTLRNTITVT